MSPRPISDEDLALVWQVAGRMVYELGGHWTVRELLGAGYVGLLNAKRLYSPDKGAAWETFALRKIKGEIIDTARKMDHTRRKSKPGFESLELLERRAGRFSGHRSAIAVPDPKARDVAKDAEDRDYVAWIKRGLNDLESRVVTAYYERGIIEKDIGLILGKSEARVSQLLRDALKVMRARVRAAGGAA